MKKSKGEENLNVKDSNKINNSHEETVYKGVKVTNSYFCYKCGAVMTTIEDKNQHDLIEKNIENEYVPETH
ncbi:MAG: hypothetical protein M3162_05570 [Thermoproteota archaeon]|nr:hypothetical protein [Thermoproteota archaeon]